MRKIVQLHGIPVIIVSDDIETRDSDCNSVKSSEKFKDLLISSLSYHFQTDWTVQLDHSDS